MVLFIRMEMKVMKTIPDTGHLCGKGWFCQIIFLSGRVGKCCLANFQLFSLSNSFRSFSSSRSLAASIKSSSLAAFSMDFCVF